MRYDITSLITYTFVSPAAGARQIMHLMPLELPLRQHLVAGRVSFDPEPSTRRDRVDFFGNCVTEAGFSETVSDISIRLHARVKVESAAPPREQGLTREALGALLLDWSDVGAQSPAHFLAPSPKVPLEPVIAAFARHAAAGAETVLATVDRVGRRIHADMKFDSKATTVRTPILEAFEKRRGVCQDFTQIMISALRSLGIPAGYVSGFLRTLPPPGKPRLEGADAMHAWVRAWCGPETGWVEFDPTNDMYAGADHVVVAYGRDYSDVVPVRGAMRISGGHKTKQVVDVVPLED